MDKQQDALNLSIKSYLWIVKRRRLRYSDEEYRIAIAELEKCFKAYEKVGDTVGEVRCLLEIARGYLDLAEADGDQKEWGLHRAENWLNRFGNDTMSAKGPSLRRHFLHARLRLLKGDIEGAEGILFEASRPVDGDDAPVLGVSYNLNGVMILLQSVPPRLEKAQMMLDKCLAALRERRVNHAVRDVRHDPIYEARCYLLLAKTKLLSRDIRGAQKCLDDWKVLSQCVEKYFLHHLGESLQKEIYREGPIFVRPFDLCDVSTKRVVKKIPDALRDYEQWLRSVLISHCGIANKKDLAKFYGKHPTNINGPRKRR